MKNRLMKYGFGAALAALALSGCIKEPNYPKEPKIEFKRVFQKTSRDALGNPIDSVTIRVRFEDGDGDLGLPKDDPRFTSSEYRFNYFTTLFYKDRGVFKEYVFPNPELTYNGRFPVLADENKVGPIEGDLDYTIQINRFGVPFDTIKLQITIKDRALNTSNTVETSEIVLGQ